MDIRQIKTFLAVAEHLNFTRAAETLRLAQPAVSISIAKLEEALELTLFNRQGRQITLTAEGEVFLRHARRIVDDLSSAEREMTELKGLVRGEVRIGIPPMLSSYYFPRVISDFRVAYPNLNLSVMGQGAGEIQQLIRSGDVDLGVIAGSNIPDGLEARCFLREEIVACVPQDHALAGRDSLRLEELWREPLILFKQGFYLREWIDSLQRDLPQTPNVVFETDLFSLVRSLIREGVGVSALLRMVVADEPQVAAVSFEPPLSLDLHIAWKSDGYLSQANQAFRDFLLERIESYRQGMVFANTEE